MGRTLRGILKRTLEDNLKDKRERKGQQDVVFLKPWRGALKGQHFEVRLYGLRREDARKKNSLEILYREGSIAVYRMYGTVEQEVPWEDPCTKKVVKYALKRNLDTEPCHTYP